MTYRLFITFFSCLFIAATTFAQEAAPANATAKAKLTTMTFDESEFEFGTIEPGEKITNVFVFENTGTEPLVIFDAKGSCGCTVPEWPKNPIMPGETAQILVQFDSKGKKGKQAKRVTLTANTEPAQTYITIRGNILAENEITTITPSADDVVVKNGGVKPDVNNFTIYPNPTTDQLMVKVAEYQGQPAQIDIFNKVGKLMQSQTIDALSSEAIRFDVGAFAGGTYTVSVKVDGMIRVAKQIAVIK